MKDLNSFVQNKNIICIMGPTASGKSHLAEQLARYLPAEIINVDSALIYRDMNIGTAKPDAKTLAEIPHHLINICDPAESYSAAKFVTDAVICIEQIHEAQKVPILVGGTMMYFKALLQGLSDLPPTNPQVRKKIAAEIQTLGLQAAHQRLASIDPKSAARINATDPQRLQRALEVFELTGKTLTELQGNRRSPLANYSTLILAIAPQSREKLHERIAMRFHQMLKQNFLDEVRSLYDRGDLTAELPAMRSVGYRQAWQYLAGNMSYEDMVEKAIIATRQLAKRQFTWLRSWEDLHWFDSDDPKLLDRVLELMTK